MDEAFLAGVKTEEVKLSNGKRMGLPVRYYDWTATLAHFPAPAKKVQEILPSSRLKPALFVPGTAIVSLATMEYRKISDVAPYNEVGIMVPVLYQPAVNVPALPLLLPQRFSRFGLYVHHLPVTTKEAYNFGVELWGFPKFVAEITFEEKNQARRCQLRADGKDIFSLEVRKWPTKQMSINYNMYTVKNKRILKTPVQATGHYGIARFKGGARYTLGNHPIADELRRVGVGEKALESQYATGLKSLLYSASETFPLD